jgi:CubicO group peptidase (beta-lactamase class C family)
MSTVVAGFTASGFEAVREVFQASFDGGDELGAGFAAILDGEVLVNLCGGFADRAQAIPWTQSTIVPVYSTTKPIAVLVLGTLVESGALNLEAPVASVWPEFSAGGKGDVTIGEALSHQAGVPGFVDPIDPGLWLDPPALASALAGLEPMWEPGTVSGYHPLTFGYIAGEIVRRVAGRSLGTILREDWTQPLDIDFWVGLPDAEHVRAAEIARPKSLPDLGVITAPKRAAFVSPWAAPNRGGAEWRRTEIPSANGHGTALSVAQLYAAYGNGGLVEGRPMFGQKVLDELTRVRQSGEDLVLPFDLAWCTGILKNSNGFYGPNPEAFGHSGWGGSCGIADPSVGLSAGYVMNQQSNALMGDPRSMRLIKALYGCL